jgi:DEAD/DEAH box helicase domain-containing protein
VLDDFLQWLRLEGRQEWEIAHKRKFPANDARLKPLPDGLDPRLLQLLAKSGMDSLYSHQTEAVEHSLNGRDTVVATATASGKTLTYQIPVLNRLIQDPKAHALFLFPLKALERDQLDSFLDLAGDSGITAAVYDGDTPEPLRRKIKSRPPQVIITNPDMLHLGLLAYHDTWKSFFGNLKFIVLDEVHTYKGIFGSHISQVLLRTLRVCESFGARPQFMACSATIANPGVFVSALINREVTVVDNSGAPSSDRTFVFIRPFLSMNVAATKMFIRALKDGLKTIVFTRARKITELVTTWVMQWAPELSKRVSSYRAGFLPEERREIESKLFSGAMDGVISTSALEMGIDVGGLDLCILIGYPGTVINTWQRGGRVGRAGRPSAVVMIAGDDALDHYFLNNPDDFFQRSCEEAVIDPYNKEVLKKHIPCAASEIVITEDEEWANQPQVAEVITELEASGALFRSRKGLHSLIRRPQRDVDLRGMGESFGIFLEENRKMIGSSSGMRVFTECHEGAVYLHRARQYVVTALDLARRNAFVRPANMSYYTRALSEKTTEILGAPIRTRKFPGFTVQEARLKVTSVITSYEKRRTSGQDLIGVVDLELPPLHFETIGIWIEIPDEVKEAIQKMNLHFMGGIHAMEHAAISMFPLFALCDRDDIGGISTPQHEQVCKAAVFIYDGHPGGVGLSHRAFEIIEELLQKTKTLVEDCQCLTGCPSCIHSPKCGSGNKPLDKEACVRTLTMLLDPSQIGKQAPPVIKREPVAARKVIRKPAAARAGAEAAPESLPATSPPTKKNGSGLLELREALGPGPSSLLFPDLAERESVEPQRGVSEAIVVPETDLVLPIPNTKKKKRPPAKPEVQLKQPENRDIIFFDLETQKLAQDVGGWKNIRKMMLSLAVTYSAKDGFRTFLENNVSELIQRLKEADLIVGYNHVRFDYEVLKAYTRENLKDLPNLDILKQVEASLGFRLKLDHLAEHTLGRHKSGSGLEAPEWFRQGKIELLEQYCKDDVIITRDLYDFGVQKGYLVYKGKNNAVGRIKVDWQG